MAMFTKHPCTFRIKHEHLIATPKLRAAHDLPIDYISASPVHGVDEFEFNAYMICYELVINKGILIESPAGWMMQFVANTVSSYCLPYAVWASAELVAKFPKLSDKIDMVPAWYGEPIKMSDNPMNPEELARCGVAREFVGAGGHIFPVSIYESVVPDTEEGRAIPRGFNNYLCVRDYFTWTSRWLLHV